MRHAAWRLLASNSSQSFGFTTATLGFSFWEIFEKCSPNFLAKVCKVLEKSVYSCRPLGFCSTSFRHSRWSLSWMLLRNFPPLIPTGASYKPAPHGPLRRRILSLTLSPKSSRTGHCASRSSRVLARDVRGTRSGTRSGLSGASTGFIVRP